MKSISKYIMLILFFVFLSKNVIAEENININISGNTAVVRLSNKPDAYSVQLKIYNTIINRNEVTKVIIDGEFGENNASGMGKQLSYTNIEELEVENSNYLPSQFYLAGANNQPGKLKSYKDDGSVKIIMSSALGRQTNNGDYNRMFSFYSPFLETIYPGVFDGYRGEELIIPQVKYSVSDTVYNLNNFEQMPNIKNIDLSGLMEIEGFGLFNQMPNLTSLNLSQLRKINSINFLKNDNKYPTYVDLSNLTVLQEKNSVGSNTSENLIYIKIGNNYPVNLYNENTNAVFYQRIAPKLNYEVRKDNNIKISSIGENSLLSYNTNDVKVSWYVDNQLSQYVGTDIDVNSENLTEGMHFFKPVISYKGKEEQSFFKDIDIKVNVLEKSLTAEPNIQETSLGKAVSTLDATKFVKNVKLGNQLLAADQYTVSLDNNFYTDIIGNNIIKARVTLISNISKFLDIDVPIKVKWGNSIVYGGYDYYNNGRTTAAFTLYSEYIPYIVASQGDIDDNLAIHSVFKKQKYYSFNLFDVSNKKNIKIDENIDGDSFIKANGEDLKKNKLREWGTNQLKVVHYGDIVRAWQIETGKNWLYENEHRQTYNNGRYSVYYEITSSGYRPLHFNQLTTKVGNIPIYSKNKYLDEHIGEYIDLKGYTNINVKGFSQYPDTKTAGSQKGKIFVEEALTTGKKIQYEYEVTLNIEQGNLSYSVPETLTFKDFSKLKDEQIIQRKYISNLGISIKDSRGSNNQGNWKLTAKAKNSNDGIDPYLIYRNEQGTDSYLNSSAVSIYTQSKQINAKEPLNVDLSDKWKNDTGILLKVPSKNKLLSKEYMSTIIWNLVEGP